MNRKLVNGLLLLSVFTVGCGTFTSCKDNEEDYKNEILLSFNDQLKKAIDEVKCTCDKELVDAMKNFLEMTKDGDQWKQQYQDIYALITGFLNGVNDNGTLKFPYGENGNITVGEALAKLNKLEDFTYNTLFIQVLKNQANVETLIAQLDKQITSIEVSQAYNHIFGTLNFPVGVQSNILGAYYFNAPEAGKFPGGYASTEVYDSDNVYLADITADEPFEWEGKTNYMNKNGNLGHLYLTMNPADKDFTGAALQLINSLGEKAPVALGAPAKNKDLLTFGWTRANDNLFGLYRVDATINPAEAGKIAPNIETGLMGAFENALKNTNNADLVELAKVLLDQLNGFLPAYAVQATTTYTGSSVVESDDADAVEPNKSSVAKNDEASENNVYSKFEIAATAVHPLSFGFLSDVSTSKKLPTFGPVSEAIEKYLNELKKKGEIKFENLDVKVEPTIITIDLGEDENGTALGTITLGYNGQDAEDGKTIEWIEGNDVAFNPIINGLLESLNGKNGLIAKLEGQVNDKISDIIDDIQNKLLGKASSADRLLAKYNQLAKTVNNFLANPNSALQVMMAYEANDGGIHRVSTDPNQPTVVKMPENGKAINLYLTTNTAEVIAPAFKKFVCPVGEKKENVTGVDLKTVLDGNQHKVGFTASATGLYKVAYSALDYRGKTSTKVYYIKVVD